MWIYQVLEGLFYTVFIASAILLIIVVLLQEGKGGGIADAFGGVGGETFGVRASAIARFTGWVALAFLGSALLIPLIHRQSENARKSAIFSGEEKKEVVTPPKEGEKK